MTAAVRRRCFAPACLALAAALAPAPPQDPPPPPPPRPAAEAEKADLPKLALARGEAALKAYDLAWLYYSEDRIDADKVYRWSRRLLEAGRDAATDKAGRVAVCRGHLDRMERIVAKVAKIRKLGFGTSLDVAEVEAYQKEAEYWLAAARLE